MQLADGNNCGSQIPGGGVYMASQDRQISLQCRGVFCSDLHQDVVIPHLNKWITRDEGLRRNATSLFIEEIRPCLDQRWGKLAHYSLRRPERHVYSQRRVKGKISLHRRWSSGEQQPRFKQFMNCVLDC